MAWQQTSSFKRQKFNKLSLFFIDNSTFAVGKYANVVVDDNSKLPNKCPKICICEMISGVVFNFAWPPTAIIGPIISPFNAKVDKVDEICQLLWSDKKEKKPWICRCFGPTKWGKKDKRDCGLCDRGRVASVICKSVGGRHLACKLDFRL